METVTAVIPHWNRRDLLGTLFESLRAQSLPFAEIMVVDNGSTDGSPELAQNLGARVLRLESNLGFAAAVNRGIALAQSTWIAILNNDVTLAPNWLDTLVKAAVEADVSFATGKILRADGSGLIDGTFDEISRGVCADRCGSGKPDSPIWNQPRQIRFAPMTAAIFRRDLFQEVGDLDETFESYLEDVDFGLRCAIARRPGVYVPRAVAYHQGSATLGAWNPDTVQRIARNQVLLTAKYFRREAWFPILAGQLLWGLLAIRHLRGWAYCKGKYAGWKLARRLARENRLPKTDERLSKIIDASEQTILELCRTTGWDRYWRAYFWASRR